MPSNLSNACFDCTPKTCSLISPLTNTAIVGILIISYSSAISYSSSTSSLQILALPSTSLLSSSNIGATLKQGLHHFAQNLQVQVHHFLRLPF